MPVRTMRIPLLLAVATIIAIASLWGQAPKKDWKDGRAEYELYEAANKATDASKRVELLNAWRKKYPDSDYSPERLVLYLNAYNELQNAEQVMRTGSEILAADPKNLTALYLMTRNTVGLVAKPTPELMSMAEKAARGLVINYDGLRPTSTPEDAWNKERPNVMALGHLSLGWIAMQRKEYPAAEKEFVASLQANGANAQVTYWLADVIRAQQSPDKNSAVIYHFIRAGFYTGPGALDDTTRKKLADYVTKMYNSFHGSSEGFDEIRTMAQTQAIPSQYPTIKSGQQLEIEKEEQFKKENPMLALWQTVKSELTRPNGAAYFESSVKGALLPGGVNGVKRFRAKLVAAKPAKNPKELVLSLEDPAGDITVTIFEEALSGSAPIGTELEFEGVPTAFTASPYMLTFEVDQETQLSGWPAPAVPAGKKGGTKKAAPPKK